MSGLAGLRPRRLLLDALAVLVPVVVVLLAQNGSTWALVTGLIASAGLLLRHWSPRLALVLCLPGLAGGLGWAAAFVALFRLGQARSQSWWLVGWVSLAAITALLPVLIWQSLPLNDLALTLTFVLIAAGSPAVIGTLIATRAQLTTSMRRLQDATEAELSAKVETARAEERARIAREIHDAVGHHVTLIAVEAAAMAANSAEPDVRDSAIRVRGLAKEALGEMRSTLGLASEERDSAGARAIPELVARAQRSGVRVVLSDECSEAVQLSSGVSRAVYRVVQEALTNVSKHAPGAEVMVELTGSDDRLQVVVRNGAPTLDLRAVPVGDAADVGRGGSGLAGLSERVRMLGGTLEAAPAAEGFELRAELPLSQL
ncbi:sensor histidine kinase [Saccharopolyspora gloriosae]|uniref:sensor histidine kinase n=1 Tax=Saccharopolyspora gloriosae TaxID=455344 RepID=UPI001FB63B9F|nr:histidine kinase [Saccharopolyspora gloriosae]